MYAGGRQAKVCWPLFFVCRMAAAIAHFARTAVFFSKTCDCQPPNDCFSQKRAIVNPRTIVFLKNMRLSPPERLFFSKMSDCQPPNERFSQKHAIVNPRTGRRNDATAHIAHRIACCRAQQFILTPESFVARRNNSY